MDRAKGRAKEAYGAVKGDESKKAEGRAEHVEKERDRQRRKDKDGLGGITDSLTGR